MPKCTGLLVYAAALKNDKVGRSAYCLNYTVTNVVVVLDVPMPKVEKLAFLSVE